MKSKLNLFLTFILSIILELVSVLSPYIELTDYYINNIWLLTIRILLIIFGLVNLFIIIKKDNLSKLYSIIVLIINIILIISIILTIIFNFILIPSKINGKSMEPNYHENDKIVIKVSNNIDYDDVIVFKYDDEYLIKRVIGMEGDTISIIDNYVHINGNIKEYTYYNNDYLDNIDPKYTNNNPLFILNNGNYTYLDKIPEGYVFVLGDNRDYSNSHNLISIDSLSIGLIEKTTIVGKI